MDAFFLYLEREEQPMHVGGICIYEGKLPFRTFRQNLASRLHLIPRYLQRVVPAPFNLGHPTWEDDPEFDIDNHLIRVKLPAPATDAELRDYASEVYTGTLDRDKPLWEIYFIEGLEGGRTAMMFKVHHAMVDGIAGIGLAYVLLDVVPDAPKMRKKPFKARPLPDQATLLQEAVWDSTVGSIEHWGRFQRSLIEFGQGFDREDLARAIAKFGTTMGTFLMPFKRLPFNTSLDGVRLVAYRNFAFTDARAIRAVSGGTINDVVLTVLSGAMRKYLEEYGPEKLRKYRSMRVLVPVNIRQDHEKDNLGNRISFLPIDLPLDLEDPIQRLNAIALQIKEAKESKVSGSISLMFDALQGTPALLQAASLGTVANPFVQQVLRRFTAIPPANMVCTNVPGPQIPLYSCGHRLLEIYPLVPVVLEMGINVAITSYDQRLYVTLCADGKAGYDVELAAEFFEEAFAELRESAAVKEAAYVKVTREAEMSAAPPEDPATTATANRSATPKTEAPMNGKQKAEAKPSKSKKARKKKAGTTKKSSSKAKSAPKSETAGSSKN